MNEKVRLQVDVGLVVLVVVVGRCADSVYESL